MKKWIALLLAAALCLILTACGDDKTEENPGTVQEQTTADSLQDTGTSSSAELTEQTVEITLDNWQDYFEFRPDVHVLKDSNNEIRGMQVIFKFFPKEAIAENIVDVGEDDERIVFDAQYIDPYACVFSYDLNTQKLTIGEYAEDSSTYSADDLLPSEDWSGTYDSIYNGAYFPTDGFRLNMYPLNKYDDCTVTDAIIESYGYAYSSVEITRIKGTVTILK
ncbi:MAG: hypothetical protein PUD22_07065 [Erysipelotrichaceae bacterium]|nr:hypothetical protein [Erysipelotrichaceae bacterium]